MIYKKRKCKSCLEIFTPEVYNQKYCSKKCARSRGKKCTDCGKSIKYEAIRCHSCANKYNKNSMWNGGKKKTIRGYIKILKSNHPNSDNHGYIMEHRLVMEAWLRENNKNSQFLVKIRGKKYLKSIAVIHHINEIKTDNRIENLMLFENSSKHSLFHFSALYYLSNSRTDNNLINYVNWFENKFKTKIIYANRDLKKILK